jgi:tetratricopeptide (TPR) repeat protein
VADPVDARGTRSLNLRARALLLAAAALAVACGPGSRTDRPRAVVIGIDGADWKIIDGLVAAGRMPNLARLRERGTSGPIQTLTDFPLSPVIWTSVATGKTPAKHGITWFLVDQPDGTRVPVRSHNRKAKALWNILAERKLRPVVIGWWATHPAEDVGSGVIVSDAIGFHGFGRTAREGHDPRKTWPADLFPRVEARMPPEQQLSPEFAARFLHLTPEEFRAERFDPARSSQRDPRNPVQLFQQYAVTAQGYTAIAEDLLAQPYDLLLLYYEQVDSFSHLFMKYAPPRLDWTQPEEAARYQDVVSEWYAYQDELLGRLLARIDLDTTAVFLLSDHGFKSGERRIRSEQPVDLRTAHLDHEPEGIFLAAGPHIRRGARVEDASVLDLTPTVLHYLGLPPAKDMDGKVLTAIFEPEFESEHPLTYVASYESAKPESKPGEPAEDYGKQELAENLAGLEALGYVKGEKKEEATAEASSPEIHDNLARIHLREGRLDEAVAEFEKALALNPHDADALLGLAGIAALRGNRPRAEHLAQVALASNPDFPPALAQLAELRRDAGDLDEAIRLYREALALDDTSPNLHLGLGDCLSRAGKYAEAEKAFRRVISLQPDSFEAWYNLGVSTSQQGRFDESVAAYQKALALDPKHPLYAAALNNLGTVQLDRGKKDLAIARWQEAVKASPTQLEARYNLASQYLDQGRVDDAIPLLEEAARLAPNHELVHARLGRAYLRKGRGEDAWRTLTLVRRLYPENWNALLGLAALQAAGDQPDQARKLLDEALRLGGKKARAEAGSYPALSPLLAAAPFAGRANEQGGE